MLFYICSLFPFRLDWGLLPIPNRLTYYIGDEWVESDEPQSHPTSTLKAPGGYTKEIFRFLWFICSSIQRAVSWSSKSINGHCCLSMEGREYHGWCSIPLTHHSAKFLGLFSLKRFQQDWIASQPAENICDISWGQFIEFIKTYFKPTESSTHREQYPQELSFPWVATGIRWNFNDFCSRVAFMLATALLNVTTRPARHKRVRHMTELWLELGIHIFLRKLFWNHGT